MASPERRRQAALIAVHTSWANTTDRAARTRKATEASPMSLEGQIAKLRAEREYASEEDLIKAAQNALTAEATRRGLAGAETRRRNKQAKQDAARLAASA